MLNQDILDKWSKVQIHCAPFPAPLSYMGRENANDGWPVNRDDPQRGVQNAVYRAGIHRKTITDVLFYLVHETDPKMQAGTWIAAACYTVKGPALRFMDALLRGNHAKHPWSERIKHGPLDGLDELRRRAAQVTSEEVIEGALRVATEYFDQKLILIHDQPATSPANVVWHKLTI